MQSKNNLFGTSSVNSNTHNIAQSPLFFVRGGGVWSGRSNPFGLAGQDGYYWFSRAYSNTDYAYSLYFATGVNPSSNDYRYYGYSLRCLIPTT